MPNDQKAKYQKITNLFFIINQLKSKTSMCDSANYPDYCSSCTPAVDDAINNNGALGETNRPSLELAFLNGCYGDDNTNCLIPFGYQGVWDNVNAAGVTWRGSNPDKPLPPKPPR